MCRHLCTVSVTGMNVAEYGVVGLYDAHHLRHHVGCAPRRTTHILVWCIAVDGCVRADGIDSLLLAADDGRLFDVSYNPAVHIAVGYRFNSL